MLRAEEYRRSQPGEPVRIREVVVVGIEAPLLEDVLDHQPLLADALAGHVLLQRVPRDERWRGVHSVQPEDIHERERGGGVHQSTRERAGRVVGRSLHADQPDVVPLGSEHSPDALLDVHQPLGVRLRWPGLDEQLGVRPVLGVEQHDPVAGEGRVYPDDDVTCAVGG